MELEERGVARDEAREVSWRQIFLKDFVCFKGIWA